MNKPIAFLFLSLALLSCGKRREPVTLTLLSYNVGVFSKYEDNTVSQVADVIREADASLVALNELDSCNRRHATFQLQELADALVKRVTEWNAK